MIYDSVILGSRRFSKEANEMGRQIMQKGFSVKLISDPAPRIETEGLEAVKKLKTEHQKQHACMPIFAVEPLNSNEEELKIMSTRKLDEIASHSAKTK